MNSVFYRKKKEEYAEMLNVFVQIKKYADNCPPKIENSRKYIDDLIISQDSIDKGLLKGKISNLIGDISETLDSLIMECNNKINEYEVLYKKELESERLEAERIRRKNRLKNFFDRLF